MSILREIDTGEEIDLQDYADAYLNTEIDDSGDYIISNDGTTLGEDNRAFVVKYPIYEISAINNSGLDNNLGGLFITTPLILLFVPSFDEYEHLSIVSHFPLVVI